MSEGKMMRRQSVQRMWDLFLADAAVTQDETLAMPTAEFNTIVEKFIPEGVVREKLVNVRNDLISQADNELLRHNPTEANNYVPQVIS
eukprot:TRINITY_DN11086_c0_g1_i1.p2 TRINITY_DN11086_c0_g1~~TRINITY_DN11086_c0_g1_i1.p2  ORF type:complete len:100 (+),score=33.78 TRINITY_DN11086_c0_g1_i1:37-300(+)